MKRIATLFTALAVIVSVWYIGSLIKPKSIGNACYADATKGPPCDCYCTKCNILQSIYNQYDDGRLQTAVDWSTSSDCEIKLVVSAAPLYGDPTFKLDPQYFIGDWKYVGEKGPLSGGSGVDEVWGVPNTYPDHTDVYGNVDYYWIGWEIQVYMIRLCDNTIIGWSDEKIVSCH